MKSIYEIIVCYIEKMTRSYLDFEDSLIVFEIFGSYSNQEHYTLNRAYNSDLNKKHIDEAKDSFMKFAGEHFEEKSFDYSELEDVVYLGNRLYEYDDELDDRLKYCFLLIAVAILLKPYIKKKETYSIKTINDLIGFKVFNYSFFRGQSNSSWRLVPSSLRGLTDNILFNHEYYKILLEKYSFNIKYNNLIKYKTDECIYYEYAFMQHACSYSPLLDFTTSEVAAISFSLSNISDINSFNNYSSKIFYIGFNDDESIIYDEKEVDSFLINQNAMLYINKEYIGFGDTVSFLNNNKEVCFEALEDIVKLLVPNYKVIYIATNDRMKYQKGAFLAFYGCLCLKGKIFYELCSGIKFIEFNVKCEDKNIFLDEISKKHSEYDSLHIMDPYLYFQGK